MRTTFDQIRRIADQPCEYVVVVVVVVVVPLQACVWVTSAHCKRLPSIVTPISVLYSASDFTALAVSVERCFTFSCVAFPMMTGECCSSSTSNSLTWARPLTLATSVSPLPSALS